MNDQNRCNINPRKVVVIGCGFVGSAISFCLMQSGLFSEMVLIDADEAKAQGEAMDIGHGVPYVGNIRIYAGDYGDVKDAAMIIITAGVSQKVGESRLDLVQRNVDIFQMIIPKIKAAGFEGILLIVSNPVDILSYTAWRISGFPKERVIGSGTVLDTGRLKYRLGQHLNVDSRSVHAFIIGEHGDSEIAAFSSANVSGIALSDFCKLRGHFCEEGTYDAIEEQVRSSAYEIIEKKHATYYGIAMAVKRICEAIVKDEKSILPLSHFMEGEYGIRDIYLSMPVVVGKNGIEARVPITLDEEEQKALQESAGILKEISEKIKF